MADFCSTFCCRTNIFLARQIVLSNLLVCLLTPCCLRRGTDGDRHLRKWGWGEEWGGGGAITLHFHHQHETPKDEINVPIALSAFRHKRETPCASVLFKYPWMACCFSAKSVFVWMQTCYKNATLCDDKFKKNNDVKKKTTSLLKSIYWFTD